MPAAVPRAYVAVATALLCLAACGGSSGTTGAHAAPGVAVSSSPDPSPSSPSPSPTASPTVSVKPTPSVTPKPSPKPPTKPAPPVVVTPTRLAYPAVFFAAYGPRIGVYSSANGHFLHWFTTVAIDAGLPQVSPDRRWVYYIKVSAVPSYTCPDLFRRPYAGGTEQFIRDGQHGGAQPFAVGPGKASAGTIACIATAAMQVYDVAGVVHMVLGVRNTGANGMAWAPSGRTLAISGGGSVYLFPVDAASDFLSSPKVPCPSSMPHCTTEAPSYATSGALYFVAKSADHRKAVVARLVGGAVQVVFTLPSVPWLAHLSVAPSGAVLVSAESGVDGAQTSTFAGRWDGVTLTRIATSYVQAAW